MNQRSMVAHRGRLLPAGVLLYLACSPTDPGCIDICTVCSVLEGTVASSAGLPVGGADVELRVMYDGPSGGGEIMCVLEEDELDLTTTDSTGTFFARLDALSIYLPIASK